MCLYLQNWNGFQILQLKGLGIFWKFVLELNSRTGLNFMSICNDTKRYRQLSIKYYLDSIVAKKLSPSCNTNPAIDWKSFYLPPPQAQAW